MEISEVQKWLSPIFKELDEISVEIEGTSEKGDGYMGDILFATVKGIGKSKEPEEIHVVLKCSKDSEQLREKMPVQAAFLNEIVTYESIFPAFLQFELEHGIQDPFSSCVPKFYGKFVTENREVLVFEDLKKTGYTLCDRKLPLPREYLRKILQEYAKFHAISVAMQDQQPERFKQLTGQLQDVMKLFMEVEHFLEGFENNLDDISQLLRGVLEDSVLDEWHKMRINADDIVSIVPNESELTVITHGDCWGNNFMFQAPTQYHGPIVSIIDWQITRPSSPILDLTYLLFTTVSKEDISTLNELLDEYYHIFTDHVRILGTNPEIYNKATFLEEWRKYSCYGLIMSAMIVKLCLSEQEELPDLTDTVTKNQDIRREIGNKEAYKDRMAYIVEYAVREGLLKHLSSNK